MAQFGHYYNTLLDSSGNALSGISVTVRKQGATVNGLQNAATITVRDTGNIADGDICRVNAGTIDVGTVLSHTATTITFDQSVSVADLDRLTPRNNLPTIYDEATGADSRTNPTTTSATGFFDFWVRGGAYDLHMTGTGIADTLVRDAWVQGSNMIVGTHGTPAYILDTNHTLSGADLLLSIRNNGVEKFALTQAGALTLQASLTAGSGVFSGALQGTALQLSGGSGSVTGVGDLTMTGMLYGKRVRFVDSGTTLASGDFTLTGFGATASWAAVTTCKDTRGAFTVTAGGAGPTTYPSVTLTFADGTFGTNTHVLASCFRSGGSLSIGIRQTTYSPTAWGVTLDLSGAPSPGDVFNIVYWTFA